MGGEKQEKLNENLRKITELGMKRVYDMVHESLGSSEVGEKGETHENDEKDEQIGENGERKGENGGIEENGAKMEDAGDEKTSADEAGEQKRKIINGWRVGEWMVFESDEEGECVVEEESGEYYQPEAIFQYADIRYSGSNTSENKLKTD